MSCVCCIVVVAVVVSDDDGDDDGVYSVPSSKTALSACALGAGEMGHPGDDEV